MTLERGARLGALEITGELGAGGMGVVYRARDLNRGCDVAVKVLPTGLADDAERRRRFDREARLLASLHHPNIAEMLEVIDSGPQRVLVMELIEGPTLAESLEHGPLALEIALAIAHQVAVALEYAHARGIIHRDLKPANVKIRPDGVVKILDFGLARAVGGDAPAGEIGAGPEPITGLETRAGVILGTATYMSPEQARGKTVDRRTDIWSFGCVLYEMLTGRRTFEGETMSDTLAATLTADPDLSALPAETCPRLRLLLRRCLAKDPRQRLHAIADARLEIEDALMAQTSGEVAESEVGPLRARRTSRRARVAWASLGVMLASVSVAGLALSGVWPHPRPPAPRPLRLSVVPTEERDIGSAVISPDGRRIAYTARTSGGTSMIWVRDLDSFTPRVLGGTENGDVPFWSPDSKELGFSAGGALKRIPADGGPAQVVSALTFESATWAPDGTILVSGAGNGLRKVRMSAGTVENLTCLTGEDWRIDSPSFLPDGRRFLFTARLTDRSAETGLQGIYLGTLDSPVAQRLLPDLSSSVYAPPGYVVFAREGKLMAVPFDLHAGVISGSPVSLGEGLRISRGRGPQFSVAAEGTLALRIPGDLRPSEHEHQQDEIRLVFDWVPALASGRRETLR